MSSLIIPYETAKFTGPNAKFNSGRRGTRSGSSLRANTTTAYANTLNTTWSEVQLHAATVGDFSFPLGVNSQRPWIEFLWRRAMVLSSLREQDGYLVQSDSYRRLDPTEKGAVSYFLGMTQASLLAEKVLGMSPVTHVDDLLKWAFGGVPQQSRPDLIGYDPTSKSGKLILEAKGRSDAFDWDPIISAKCQVSRKPPRGCKCARCKSRRTTGRAIPGNPADRLVKGSDVLRVASLSFFDRFDPPRVQGAQPQPSAVPGVWRSYLEDPIIDDDGFPDADLSEPQFRGLVLISQLMPIVRIIQSLEGEDFPQTKSGARGITSVLLPDLETRIGLPTAVFKVLARFDGHIVDDTRNIKIAESVADLIAGGEPGGARLEPEDESWETATTRAGVSIATATTSQEWMRTKDY